MREENSPKLAIVLFFDAVVDVLGPLCSSRGWETQRKDPCVRVIISGSAH